MPDELLCICDENGALYAVWTQAGKEESDPVLQQIDQLCAGLEQVLRTAKGSVIRTSAKPGTKLQKFMDSVPATPEPQIPVEIYPIFHSKFPCELYAVAIKITNNSLENFSLTNDLQSRLRANSANSNIAYSIVDARTGMFLESNKAFQEMVAITAPKLMRSRCAEIGMKDLLLLATLNADRRCFFHAQVNANQPKRWFLSEMIVFGDRECLRIWCPNEVSFPESHMNGSELAKAYCSSWQNKPDRVLICDDNELLVDTCSSIMDWAQIRYDVANNGKEALQLLEEEKYDCLLLDLNMPKLNGFDTARLIRHSKRMYRHLPIIAMTATPLTQRDLASQLKHFDAILQKPFDIEDIKTSVDHARNHLRIKNSIQQNAFPQSIDNMPADEFHHEDYEPTSFMVQFSDRADILENLRTRMLNNLQANLDFLKSLDLRSQTSQLKSLVQRSQSMATSIGAWKLATHSGLFLDRLEHPETSEFTEAREALIICFEEALCFYNTVDWSRFLAPLKTTSTINY